MTATLSRPGGPSTAPLVRQRSAGSRPRAGPRPAPPTPPPSTITANARLPSKPMYQAWVWAGCVAELGGSRLAERVGRQPGPGSGAARVDDARHERFAALRTTGASSRAGAAAVRRAQGLRDESGSTPLPGCRPRPRPTPSVAGSRGHGPDRSPTRPRSARVLRCGIRTAGHVDAERPVRVEAERAPPPVPSASAGSLSARPMNALLHDAANAPARSIAPGAFALEVAERLPVDGQRLRARRAASRRWRPP